MQRVEAALSRVRSQRRPDGHSSGDTFELCCPEILKFKQIPEEPSCAFGDDHRVWLCDPLQARGNVWRFANNSALLRIARSDQIADDH